MNELFITCGSGLELLLIDELKLLGIHARKGFRGVYAPQTMENVYLINYCSRIATRVLWPLSEFPCRDRNQLYAEAKKIDWTRYLNLEKTFAIDANVTHPNLRNSLFASFVVKDAICDQFRDKCGARPSVDVASPHVQLNLFVQNTKAILSIDTSGAPLYKRGYRQDSVTAPIQESLAAAILALAAYQPDDILCDPFCGSGTFLVEAAMRATNTPAGYFRTSWGFMQLPDFHQETWIQLKVAQDQKRIPLTPGTIFGCDKDAHTLAICRNQLKNTGFPIEVTQGEVKAFQPPKTPTLVVANPPYGKRLASSNQPYRELGEFLRPLKNTRAAILSPEPSAIPLFGRPVTKKTALSNGGLNVILYQWE